MRTIARTPGDADLAFRRVLLEPPTAVVAGVHAEELAHNRAIHFVVKSARGPAFVRALAAHALGRSLSAGGPAVAALRRVIAAPSLTVTASYQPRMKDRRGDEVIEVNAGTGIVDLVIEMKVEAAEDLGQVRGYVTTQKQKHPGHDVVAVMLVVGDRTAEVLDDLVVIGGQELRCALLDSVSAETPARLRGSLNDYRRTVAYLELRDSRILNPRDPSGFRDAEDEVLSRWAKEEWRWIQRRIAREVERKLTSDLPAVLCIKGFDQRRRDGNGG